MGTHTIAMDAYPFIAADARVVDGVFTQRDPALRRARAKTIPGRDRF